tara:strand:- start:87 stop:749 length:663 start_codon:yes stop_codon:yes gene_type:complete
MMRARSTAEVVMRLIALISMIVVCSGCSKSELSPQEVEAVQKTNAVVSPAKAPPAAAADDTKKPAAAKEAAEATKPEAALAQKLDGTSYGSGVTLPETVSISELKANVDKYAGKEVRIEGMVTGVCPKRGCWFDMAGEKAGESMRFKVKDGVMVFPMEASGKYAVAQGTVRKMPMTLEQSKRWATYQRDSYGIDIDPDAINEPLTIVRLDGSGAVIRDAK